MSVNTAFMHAVFTKTTNFSGKNAETDPKINKTLKVRTIMFDIIRELAYGLKLGARHSFDTRHYMTERAIRPSVSAAMKNASVGAEQAGR